MASYTVAGNGKTATVEVDLDKDDLCSVLRNAASSLGCERNGTYLVSREGWKNGPCTVKMS